MRRRFNSAWARLPGTLAAGERSDRGDGAVRRRAAVVLGTARQPKRLVMMVAMVLTAGGAILASGPAEPERMAVVEPVRAELDGNDAVSQAWRKRALEREAERVTARFAQEFSIPSELAGQIVAAAEKHEVEPEIAFGLVRTESSFRRTVVSHAGAVGYTQLLPSTARWIAPGTTRASLFDTETNLDVGFRYLRYLKDKYEGDVDLALTAYNRGQGRVDRLLRAGRNPDNGYATAVRTGHVSQKLIRQNSPRG